MPNAPPHRPAVAASWRKAVPVAVALVLLTLALRGLAGEFQGKGYEELKDAVRDLSYGRVLLAFLLGLASYLCLVAFDAIGLRRTGHKMPLPRLAVTAFLANAVGHTVGFAALSGGSVRLRGYGAAGLSFMEVGQVVVISSLGFIFGAWVLLAMALLLEPDLAARALPFTGAAIRAAGSVLGVAFVAMFVLAGPDGRTLRWRTHELWLPDRRTTLTVTVISLVELFLAGAALWVLLAPIAGIGFFGFVGAWLVAVVAGLLSSVPGGLGVFEWSLLKLMPGIDPPTLIAAALVYRVTYYFAPLLLATLMAAIGAARKPVLHGSGLAWKAMRPWLPQTIAIAVFAVGAALVLDGTLPVARRKIIATPLSLLETSHLLASLGGIALLLIGQGLQRRSRTAWLMAMAICVMLPLPSYLRGGHASVAICSLLVAVALWASRREFYRQGALLDEALSWRWLLNLGMVLIAAVWLLFFVYSHVEYQNELWWKFATTDSAPRALRALLIGSLALMAFGLARMMRSARARLPSATPAQLATLGPILAGAHDSQANLVLTGDKALLQDAEGKGFVMLQRYGGSLISMGDPVGPPDVARALIWKFREEADRMGIRPVFYQVGEAYWQTYLDLGLGLVKLGEEALVSLADFSLEGRPRAELRQAWNKGARTGMSFRVLAPEEVAPYLPVLAEISDEWLEEKSGDEKGFSLGSFDNDYLCRFPVAVVEFEGRIVAFANVWSAPAGKELSVDLMRHADDAPKGTMDYLFVGMFLWGQAQGYQQFSLGMAPLSGMAEHRLAGRWNRFAGLVARHGERFYGFSGLRKFKQKFGPTWRTRYLAAPGGVHLPAALLDVTRLISLDPRGEDDRDEVRVPPAVHAEPLPVQPAAG